MKKATLFQTGNDLSEGLVSVQRRLKGDTFDVYEFIEDDSVTIKHSAKRGAPILIKEDKYNGNTYVAGDAYDVFNVWVRVRNAVPGGQSGLNVCIAEDVLSFDDALAIAQEHIQDVQFEMEMVEEFCHV